MGISVQSSPYPDTSSQTGPSTILGRMGRKKRSGSDFGQRLAALRKARGLTQVDLARAIDSTQRAISYYENVADYPPAPVIAKLGAALGTTCDDLLGTKPIRQSKQAADPDSRRFWRKFQEVRTLAEKDQRAVLRLINSLALSRGSKGSAPESTVTSRAGTSTGAAGAPAASASSPSSRSSRRSRRLQHA